MLMHQSIRSVYFLMYWDKSQWANNYIKRLQWRLYIFGMFTIVPDFHVWVTGPSYVQDSRPVWKMCTTQQSHSCRGNLELSQTALNLVFVFLKSYSYIFCGEYVCTLQVSLHLSERRSCHSVWFQVKMYMFSHNIVFNLCLNAIAEGNPLLNGGMSVIS